MLILSRYESKGWKRKKSEIICKSLIIFSLNFLSSFVFLHLRCRNERDAASDVSRTSLALTERCRYIKLIGLNFKSERADRGRGEIKSVFIHTSGIANRWRTLLKDEEDNFCSDCVSDLKGNKLHEVDSLIFFLIFNARIRSNLWYSRLPMCYL